MRNSYIKYCGNAILDVIGEETGFSEFLPLSRRWDQLALLLDFDGKLGEHLL